MKSKTRIDSPTPGALARATLTQIFVDFENCRERKVKNKLLAKILKDTYPVELNDVSLDRIVDMVKHTLRHDRAWRKVLEDNEGLRGKDYYAEKDRLEDEAQIEMGYTPGFDQDVKKLNKITKEE